MPTITTTTSDRPCTQEDPELFFSTSPLVIEEAKRICHRCPHVLECLREALATREEHGVFGGMSATERIGLVRATTRTTKRTTKVVAA